MVIESFPTPYEIRLWQVFALVHDFFAIAGKEAITKNALKNGDSAPNRKRADR